MQVEFKGGRKVKCKYCGGFVEHVIVDDTPIPMIEHTCVNCNRDMDVDFVCHTTLCRRIPDVQY